MTHKISDDKELVAAKKKAHQAASYPGDPIANYRKVMHEEGYIYTWELGWHKKESK